MASPLLTAYQLRDLEFEAFSCHWDSCWDEESLKNCVIYWKKYPRGLGPYRVCRSLEKLQSLWVESTGSEAVLDLESIAASPADSWAIYWWSHPIWEENIFPLNYHLKAAKFILYLLSNLKTKPNVSSEISFFFISRVDSSLPC